MLAATAVALLPLAGCGGGTPAVNAPAPVQQTQNHVAGTNNPLVARYYVTASQAATVVVQFGPTTNYGFQTSPQTIPEGGGTVDVLVAGMKQNTQYHMRAVLTTSSGQILDQDRTFQTGAIPAGSIPAMNLTITPGQQPTSGIQLVSGVVTEFAINPAGDVVWFYKNNPGDAPYLVKLLPNGNMLMILNLTGPPASSELREVDLSGTTVRSVTLLSLNQELRQDGYNVRATSIDHDALLMPNGHLLFIVTHSRVFTDLPGYPGQTTVFGNAVVDVDQAGRPAWVWDAFDHLDVNRHPIYFPDWTHANALFYIPDDGSLLLSVRHQHWVLKIDYANGTGSGDVIWKLGYQGDFTLLDSSSPADWFYAQHDANIISQNLTGDFQLAAFDNGNFRVLDESGDTCNPMGNPPCYSTAAIFDVNETNMTAQRLWTFQSPFSLWGGSNQLLTSSNMLVNETAPSDLPGSRALEMTQEPNPTIIWKLEFQPGAYRTLHMPSLYPKVQW